MFAVIYRSYIKKEAEIEYQKLWKQVAGYFIQYRGALGSCLHKTDDGIWVAYSRWPNKAARDASWPGEGATSNELPDEIKEVIVRIKECADPNHKLPEICMEVVDDMLLAHMCKSLNVNITTRKYQPGDVRALADIFYQTIHNVNSRDYSETQINAWAPASSLELTGWKEKWSKLPPIVALSNHKIVGFAEFESDGHIDCFYVHHEYQNKSVGTCLMNAIEREANAKNITRIYAEVSITAKSFFEKKGFDVIKQQSVLIRGCELTNFVMEKCLTPFATFRLLEQADIPVIAEAFQLINWGKPASLFEAYLEEQRNDQRNIWLAYVDDKFAGYVTLKWQSEYGSFADRGVPEVKDLNVLPVYQGKGIGSKLLEIAESAAYTKSNTVGLGVGLFADYGNAQRLYIKRGYIPDGFGVTYQYKELSFGSQVQLDDDLVLWLTKSVC